MAEGTVTLCSAEWGHSSATYDFDFVCVLHRGGRSHYIPGGRLAYALLTCFFRSQQIYFGWGNNERDRLYKYRDSLRPARKGSASPPAKA